RAQICGDEGQPADPCRDRPAGKKEVVAGAHVALQSKSDAQHEDEVDQHDQPVNECKLHAQPACLKRDYWYPALVRDFIIRTSEKCATRPPSPSRSSSCLCSQPPRAVQTTYVTSRNAPDRLPNATLSKVHSGNRGGSRCPQRRACSHLLSPHISFSPLATARR